LHMSIGNWLRQLSLPAAISDGWASILFPHRSADLWMVRCSVSHLGSAFFKRLSCVINARLPLSFDWLEGHKRRRFSRLEQPTPLGKLQSFAWAIAIYFNWWWGWVFRWKTRSLTQRTQLKWMLVESFLRESEYN